MKPSGWILTLLITGTIFGTWQGPSLSHYQDEEPLSIRAQGMGGILPLPVQDPSVVLFNPAGLGWREGGSVFVLAGILQEKGPPNNSRSS